MHDYKEFLTVVVTFGSLDIVKKTLPTVLKESVDTNSALIVHDCTTGTEQNEKWEFLRKLNRNNQFFLLLSSNMTTATSRDVCMSIGKELFLPDYICVMEDDHGYRPGFVSAMKGAIQKYYGQRSPNGLRYGFFSGCTCCVGTKSNRIALQPDGHGYPTRDSLPGWMGGCNGCFRCAPTKHWDYVLRHHDVDEYIVSNYQVKHLNTRNYNRGFTTLYLENGSKVFNIKRIGRGGSSGALVKKGIQRLWDDGYTRSDSRAKYRRA